jgi:tetratricopeptide (TPR) repeat protein
MPTTRMRGLQLSVLLLGCAGVASAQVPTGESVAAPRAAAVQPLAEALARFKAGDTAGSLKALRVAVAANAELPPAQVLLAQWFSQAEQAGPMRAALDRAVAEEPNDPEAYVLLSDVALGEGRLTDAELLCYRAYTLLQSFQRSARRKKLLLPRVFANLAAASEAREDWRNAQKYLAAWVAAEPENPVAMQRVGQVLFRLGQLSEALDCFRLAAKRDPNLLAPEVILGRLYEQAGQRDKASQSMAAAIAARSKDLQVRLAVAQWALETGQYGEAYKHAEAAAQLAPDSAEARHLRGLVCLMQRDFTGAEEIFAAALKQAPTSFSARNNLAVALAEQLSPVQRRQALEHAQINVRQHPRQPDAYSTLGWTLYRLGARDEAERALLMASFSGMMSPDTAYFLARIAVDEGRPDDARPLLQTALTTKGLFLLRKEAEELWNKLK